MLNLRYQCAYEHIDKLFWWDKTGGGGPIVEQATHLVDLSRFLVQSEIDTSFVGRKTIILPFICFRTLNTQTIEPPHPYANLKNQHIDVVEAERTGKIRKENQIPRATIGQILLTFNFDITEFNPIAFDHKIENCPNFSVEI